MILDPLPMSYAETRAAIRTVLTRQHDVDYAHCVVGYLAHHDPDATAVVDRGGRTTYGQLRRAVAGIRAEMAEHGVRSGQIVAAAGARGVGTIAVFLALESMGAIYLPIDQAWPEGRLTSVLGRAEADHLVVYGPEGEALAEVAGEIGLSPLRIGDIGGYGPEQAERVRCDDSSEPRYVIFTSGTTGQPKGAVIEHRGMMNHLWAKALDLGLNTGDVVAFSAPLVFDIAIWQMLAPLMVGATVAVVDDADLQFPRRLTRAMRDAGVTILELVPTAIGWLLDGLYNIGGLPRLRWLITTGEEMRRELAARVLECLPNTVLLNAYGPTECSDDVTHHMITRESLASPRLPIGRPIANAALYLLVDDGLSWRAAQDGELGELFVGGAPVGRGYLNDPAATGGAFFCDPFDPGSPTGRIYRTGDMGIVVDGVMHFLGRRDRQVKLSGVRMELDEIELVLGRHPGVTQCAVVIEDDLLVACYSGTAPVAELQTYIQSKLPEAMVPRRWIPLQTLPLNGNGKIDHQALREESRHAK